MKKSKEGLHSVQNLLNVLKSQYDYILVDCSPSLNVLNASISIATDQILLPYRPNRFSTMALEQTITEFTELQNQFNGHAALRIILNDYQSSVENRKFLTGIASRERSRFLNTTIRSSTEIENGLNNSTDFYKNTESKSRIDFDNLTREIFTITESLNAYARHQ